MRIVQRRNPISNFFSYVKSFGKLNILFFAIFIAFAIAIMAQFTNPKVLQNLFSDAAYDPSTRTFLATFSESPTSPQPLNQIDELKNFDVVVHSRDSNTLETLEEMEADHGTDCSANPDNTLFPKHHIPGIYLDSVFNCKNHIMTAIKAGGYGEIILTPNAKVDLSNGTATISVDVSTYRSSSRDWWGVTISPYDQQLVLPLEDWLPDLDGYPVNGLHFGVSSVISAEQIVDGKTNGIDNLWWVKSDDIGVVQSKANRAKYVFTISKTHVTAGIQIPATNGACPHTDWTLTDTTCKFNWVDKDLATPLTWNEGIVQFEHHSYNPEKDCDVANPPAPDGTCKANTWHWDNFSINPANPFTIIKSNEWRYVGNNTSQTTATFKTPAPSNSHLRFAAVCRVQISLNDGQFFSPTNQATTKHAAGDLDTNQGAKHSYFVPIPEGTNKVKFQLAPDGWYTNWPCTIDDIAIWSANTPNGTPSNPTPTSTGSVPTPTTPPVQPTATNAPTPTSTPIPTPTPTKVASKDAIITLQPKTKDVISGQTLTMDIMIDTTGKSINAAEATISFPPSLLTNASVSIDKTIFPIETGQNITNGTITISAASSTPRSGIVRLATISFKTASQGTANVNFSNVAIIESATNQDVFGSAQNGTYQILPQATPTPTKAQPTPTKAPAPTPSVKSSDLNGDGKVDIQDLSLLLTYRKNKDLRGDLNNDGKVNMTDVSILVKNWS